MALLLLSGCSLDFGQFTGGGMDAGVDSGPAFDAGPPMDAGPPFDAGPDAGPPFDAGDALDAGFLPMGPITAIAAGGDVTCAVVQGDELWCWGDNRSGQLGIMGNDSNVPVHITSIQNVADIHVGRHHICVVENPGAGGPRLLCWGDTSFGQAGVIGTDPVRAPTPVTLDGGVASIGGGANHTCVLIDTGSGRRVQCFGRNRFEQLGQGTPPEFTNGPVTINGTEEPDDVVGGDRHTCLRRDLTDVVKCWGDNRSGQLGTTMSVPTQTSVVRPWAGGTNEQLAIAAGASHTCAIDDLGSLSCWGDNSSGAALPMGLSTIPTPQLVPGTWDPVLAAGGFLPEDGSAESRGFTCAVRAPGGELMCWGASERGQLGQGGTCTASEPMSNRTMVVAFTGPVTDVVAGDAHTCVLSRGNVFCTGDNRRGQLGYARDPCSADFELVQGLP